MKINEQPFKTGQRVLCIAGPTGASGKSSMETGETVVFMDGRHNDDFGCMEYVFKRSSGQEAPWVIYDDQIGRVRWEDFFELLGDLPSEARTSPSDPVPLNAIIRMFLDGDQRPFMPVLRQAVPGATLEQIATGLAIARSLWEDAYGARGKSSATVIRALRAQYSQVSDEMLERVRSRAQSAWWMDQR